MAKVKNNKWLQTPNRKVTVQLLTSIVAFGASVLGLDTDPTQSAAVASVIGFIAGYIVKER